MHVLFIEVRQFVPEFRLRTPGYVAKLMNSLLKHLLRPGLGRHDRTEHQKQDGGERYLAKHRWSSLRAGEPDEIYLEMCLFPADDRVQVGGFATPPMSVAGEL